ncbi:hypothetical protein [Agrobacterium tumefaciens]|uniref:hypothetical protein n=1 Tax=Agrobacterium tumefaciens TaxID=358 RepID=UPI001572DC3A|nr:hypothetical protein [Agrobacterium tumefaciens]
MTEQTANQPNIDDRLNNGETINFYTYDGPKSDLMVIEGGKQSWKKGVAFDHPDEGSDEDRFSYGRENGATEPFSPDQLIAYLAAEGDGATFEDQNGTIHSLENGKLISETVEQTVDRLEQIAAPTDKTLSAADFAAVLNERGGEKSISTAVEAVFVDDMTADNTGGYQRQGQDIVATLANGDVYRTNAAEFGHYAEREHRAAWEQGALDHGTADEDDSTPVVGFAEEAPHTPTDNTVSAERFAAILTRWPSDEKQLGFLAEAVLEGETYDHFGQVSTFEGDQIVTRQYERDTFRTNTAEFMAFVEREYPDQMASAKAEIERREFDAKPVPHTTEHDISAEIDAALADICGKLEQGALQTEIAVSAEHGADTLTDENNDRSAWKLGDLATKIEPTAPAVVSDQIDEVFNKFADQHTAEIHGLRDQGKQLTAEQVDRLRVDVSEDDKLMQLVAEIESGFQERDPRFAELYEELDEMENIQKTLGIHASQRPDADRTSVVDFAAMADRARAAGQGQTKTRTLETEQGA